MRIHIKKQGNSASVSIPPSVMAAASIHVDQAVDIREDCGRIIIEPASAVRYRLDDLLNQMTPETFPEGIDFGAPVGGEAC